MRQKARELERATRLQAQKKIDEGKEKLDETKVRYML